MGDYKLGDMEEKFAGLIWEHAPIPSPELVKLCERELGWKKSTTYTVLKKLCQKGIFRNEDAMVTVRKSREEFYGEQSRRYVEDVFSGSLPLFLNAFYRGGKLSAKEAEEMRRFIESCEQEEEG